jgi:hypothetical protein
MSINPLIREKTIRKPELDDFIRPPPHAHMFPDQELTGMPAEFHIITRILFLHITRIPAVLPLSALLDRNLIGIV